MDNIENFDIDSDDYKIDSNSYSISENQVNNNPNSHTTNTETNLQNNVQTQVENTIKNDSVKANNTVIPTKLVCVMNLQRLGVIFSNISIICSVLFLISLVGIVLYPLAILINIVIIVILFLFTLGIIFFEYPLSTLYVVDSEFLTNAVSYLITSLPYVFGTLLVSSLLSIVFLLADKRNRNKPRIVFSSLVLIAVIIGFILLAVGIIGGAK